MRELGYTPEDLRSYAFVGHSLVNAQRDLTERSELSVAPSPLAAPLTRLLWF